MNRFIFYLQRFDGGAVCKIGETAYETFQAALTAANENDTIQIISDFTIVSGDDIKKNITLDLNGKTITLQYSSLWVGDHTKPMSEYNVTIKDTSENKTGKITGVSDLLNYAKLTILWVNFYINALYPSI